MREKKVSRRAQEYFEEGYNCCQSVFLAFGERYGFERETSARLAASFGGGVGRLREVCGTVSAMALVSGLECGATEGIDQAGKAANYEQMQRLAACFQEKTGSLICRELLGLDGRAGAVSLTENKDKEDRGNSDPSSIQGGMGNFQPQARTKEYYAARPCKELVGIAAEILEQWLEERAAQEE